MRPVRGSVYAAQGLTTCAVRVGHVLSEQHKKPSWNLSPFKLFLLARSISYIYPELGRVVGQTKLVVEAVGRSTTCARRLQSENEKINVKLVVSGTKAATC